jgi:hypothetical protein
VRWRDCGLRTQRHRPESVGRFGRRQPLGWHLDRKVLAFLATVGTGLDVDEYDMAPDEDIK